MAQSKERLRQMRQKYHLGEYSIKHTGRKSAHKRRSGFMAMRKSSHRRRGGMGGIMGMAKPLIYGTVAGLIAPKIPVLNTIPYSQAVAGAAGGYFAKRTLVGAGVGAVGGAVVAPIANNMLGSAGFRIY